MIKFQEGKTYSSKSICDSDCVFSFKILKRTAKTVTINSLFNKNETTRCKIHEYEGSEMIYPLGKYSMAPILRANK